MAKDTFPLKVLGGVASVFVVALVVVGIVALLSRGKDAAEPPARTADAGEAAEPPSSGGATAVASTPTTVVLPPAPRTPPPMLDQPAAAWSPAPSPTRSQSRPSAVSVADASAERTADTEKPAQTPRVPSRRAAQRDRVEAAKEEPPSGNRAAVAAPTPTAAEPAPSVPTRPEILGVPTRPEILGTPKLDTALRPKLVPVVPSSPTVRQPSVKPAPLPPDTSGAPPTR